MTADTAELLPCPFCGSSNISRSVGERGDSTPYPYIECDDCGAAVESQEEWNRRAALPARAPEGWVLVPREPTPEMIGAAFATRSGLKNAISLAAEDGDNTGVEAVYAAMLSAAPPPPEQEETLGSILSDLAARQEPLGKDMEVVWDQNTATLYESEEPTTEPLASPAPGRAGPMVRALEWLSPVKPFYAVTPFCQYCIDSVNDDTGPHWQTTISYQGSMYRRHDTEEEAKAAAQADYERRILSALTPAAPAPVAAQPQPSAEVVASFQARVAPWMQACFGPVISANKLERGDRLLEEVLELLQSGSYPVERVGALTGYVWSRPAGEPRQEVGGVMVTLAAYCLAHEIDMHEAGEAELARIWTKVEKIRAKQAAKPTGSALPQEWLTPPPSSDERVAAMREMLELREQQNTNLRARLDAMYSHASQIAHLAKGGSLPLEGEG